jgi:sugar diacid utilization regulator
VPAQTSFAAAAAAAASDAGGLDVQLLGSLLEDVAGAVSAGRELTAAQCRPFRARAQQAAHQGVALRALLQLYVAATWRAWPVLAGLNAPERAGAVVLRTLEQVLAALTEGFQLARRRVVREEASARREFVDDLLIGQADVGGLVRRAAGFGLDLSGPHAVAAVRAQRPFSDSAPLTARIERAIQGSKGDADVLVASKDGALVVVFAAPDRAALDAVTGAVTGLLRPPGPTAGVELRRRADVGAWRLGLGRPAPGPSGVRTSYQDACEALDTAARLGLPGAVIDSADLLVHRVLLRDRPAIAELVEGLLGPLRGARGGAAPLLATLSAYFECGGNAMQTARQLHLSVRAVTYRLERVARLTGHHPADPAQRFALHAAVLGARLLGWPPA